MARGKATDRNYESDKSWFPPFLRIAIVLKEHECQETFSLRRTYVEKSREVEERHQVI
jgi:hypothetical protein